MTAWLQNPWLTRAARFYLGGVFIYASWHKIWVPRDFAVDIATYEILPVWAINAIAIYLPWLELIVGLCLVVGVWVRAASALILVMLAVFIAAIVSAIARGMELSCGCFASKGAVADPLGWPTVWRDLGWFALGVYLASQSRTPSLLQRNEVKR